MPCCCLKILNLCKVPVCGTLELNQVATGQSGGENLYTLVLDFLDFIITIKKVQTEGQNITFDISGLSENYEYTAQVFDADGNLVTIGEDDYDCIKFRTTISIPA